MAVKKSRGASDNGETQSETRLAPPEEKERAVVRQSSPDNGTLPVNTGSLKIPQELVGEEDSTGTFLRRVDPAVIVILCCALIFIATIAYVIWSGWEPPRP